MGTIRETMFALIASFVGSFTSLFGQHRGSNAGLDTTNFYLAKGNAGLAAQQAATARGEAAINAATNHYSALSKNRFFDNAERDAMSCANGLKNSARNTTRISYLYPRDSINSRPP